MLCLQQQLEHTDEYRTFDAMEDLFELRCRGVQTARDAVVYDWNPDKLETRVTRFIAAYNAEVHRHRAEPTSDWPDQIDWSRNLKRDARGGKLASFDAAKIRAALYRPFSKRWLFFDGILSESDPNREDDPGYILRLVGQVVRVSVETVLIVKALPDYR